MRHTPVIAIQAVVLIVAGGFSGFSAGPQEATPASVRSTDAQTVNSPQPKDEYAALQARVKQGDMTVDFRAFRAAAAQASGPHSSAIETSERATFKRLLAAGDYQSALNSAQQALERNYASIVGHYDAMVACQQLNKADDATLHEKLMNALLDSIGQSGDGKSPETAYFVVTVQEEYIFLNRVLHLRGKSQSWVRKGGHLYDHLLVFDPATNQTQNLWFNADFDSSAADAVGVEKDGVLATATVIRPSVRLETPPPGPSSESAQTAGGTQPKSNFHDAAGLQSGSFHITDESDSTSTAALRVIYSLTGTYAVHDDYILVTIQSGLARSPMTEVSKPILHSLQVGVCYQDHPGGWVGPLLSSQNPALSLGDAPLNTGQTYKVPGATIVIPLPKIPPLPNWLCSVVFEKNEGNANSAHDAGHPNLIPLDVLRRRYLALATAPPNDRLDSTSIALAGPEAVDCGRVRLHADSNAATDCALNEFSKKAPFRVRYDLQGIDSAVAVGIVETRGGKLYELQFDSMAPGVREVICPESTVLVRSRDRLTCSTSVSPQNPPKKTVVEYGRYKGGVLQMVVEETGANRILLRVAVGKDVEPIDVADIDRALAFLRKEAARLTSNSTSPVALGESGYRFKYEGGYSILDTKEEVLDGIVFENLWLADDGRVVDREIRGRGADGVVSKWRPGTGRCGDRENTLASVPHDILISIQDALQASNVAEANKIAADHPELSLKIFYSSGRHGRIENYTVLSGQGCMLIMRQSSMGY